MKKLDRRDLIIVDDVLMTESIAWNQYLDEFDLKEFEAAEDGEVMIYDVRTHKLGDLPLMTAIDYAQEAREPWRVVPIMLGDMVKKRAIKPAVYAVVYLGGDSSLRGL